MLSTIVRAVSYGLGLLERVHPAAAREGVLREIAIMFPVDVTAMLVPRTHATILSVPIEYDPVSVRIRHQREPFARIAEAIVFVGVTEVS